MSKHVMFTGRSMRYCLACDKPTKFKFNEITNHSTCVVCGGYRTNVAKNSKLQKKIGKKYNNIVLQPKRFKVT